MKSGAADLPVTGSSDYRAYDLKMSIYDEDEIAVTQNLDRLLISITTPYADFYIGRQPVAFGSARVVNPTDIIAPFTYSTLATEERPGADALRIKVPTGEMSEIDAGFVAGDKMKAKESAAYLRNKSYILNTDVSIMAMVFKENVLFGADLMRSIGGAGVWLEAAFTQAGGVKNRLPEEDYFRLSTGTDYSFTRKLYAYIEYHYNGAGTGKTKEYSDIESETAYTEGTVYLLGRHYIAPGLTYEITPLIILNAGAVVNLEDSSALLSPSITYNIAENNYLKFGAYPSIGGKSGSEFAQYPDIYFISYNIYF